MVNSYTQIAGAGTPVSRGSGGTIPPGNVSSITVSGFIDPTTLTITLTAKAVSPGGTITAGHLYLEVPDQSAGTSFIVGTNVVGDGSTTVGPWTPIDCGIYPVAALVAGVTLSIPGPPGLNAKADIPSRLYVNSVSANGENPLVRANLAGPTPNATFTITSFASGTATSGTNVTGLTTVTGAPVSIVATALTPVNVTGKLETPVEVIVSDTPNIQGWVYRLVITYAGNDPTVPANQFVAAAGPFTQAGPVGQAIYELASADGVSVPHSFLLPTPTTVTNAIVWLQAGQQSTAAKAGRPGSTAGHGATNGTYQWNNIVPGITPSFPITYGSTVGTTDASAIMAATIAASMAIVAGLFGVATAGITNSLLGSGAVATLNIQGLAVGNSQLALLAVEAGNLAASSITGTAGGSGNQAIASAAVGTLAVQTAAITNLLIANAAVDYLQIVTSTIVSANIGTGQIATANIGTGQITDAKIASGTITNASIASATILDGNIANLSASKLTAGTISASVSITSPSITCNDGTRTLQFNTGDAGIKIVNNAFTNTYSYLTDQSLSLESGGVLDAIFAPTLIQLGGNQVVTTRQTGPGTASGWADSTAQSWANNLLTALRIHGLVT